MTIALGSWVAGGVGLVLVAAIGVQTVRVAGEKAAHATTRASYADERTKAAQAHARATDEQRAIYESRIKGKDDAIAQAKQIADQRATALAGAKRTADSLRDDLATYIARADQAGGGATIGPGGAAAGTPAGMLGQLFAEADHFAGIMEGAFAASRSAGLTCEQSYDSLTVKTKPAAAQ